MWKSPFTACCTGWLLAASAPQLHRTIWVNMAEGTCGWNPADKRRTRLQQVEI